MEHLTSFEHGYDCIRFECVCGSSDCHPGSGGSHGIYGLSIRFVSKGDAGAVEFLLGTGWLPQYAIPSEINAIGVSDWGGKAMPFDLEVHSKAPQYDGHRPLQRVPEYCDGQPCYYDVPAFNANDAMYALVNGGDKALWAFLDAYYESVFNGAEYPKPAEYMRPLRKTNKEQYP